MFKSALIEHLHIFIVIIAKRFCINLVFKLLFDKKNSIRTTKINKFIKLEKYSHIKVSKWFRI